MEAFGEYRVGKTPNGIDHWIECRGEVIAAVGGPVKPNEPRSIRHYGRDNKVRIQSAISGWEFEGTYRSVGHALLDAARSHRDFVEPSRVKRLWRGMALWPAWGKVAAAVVGFAAVSEILSYLAPNGGTRFIGWIAGLVSGA